MRSSFRLPHSNEVDEDGIKPSPSEETAPTLVSRADWAKSRLLTPINVNGRRDDAATVHSSCALHAVCGVELPSSVVRPF